MSTKTRVITLEITTPSDVEVNVGKLVDTLLMDVPLLLGIEEEVETCDDYDVTAEWNEEGGV